ncbi:hypothetical protein D3C73_1036460 [compost metagenome]
MVGVQDEQQVQCLDHVLVQFVLAVSRLEGLLQEAADVVQRGVRLVGRQALAVAVDQRRQGRYLGDQAHGGLAALFGVGQVQRGVIDTRQLRDGGGQDGHRMGILGEAADQGVDRLIDVGFGSQLVGEGLQLLGARALAVDQQVGHFDVARLLRQLLDRVAAIQQHALVAVDVGDGRLATGRRGETGIVGEIPRFLGQLRDVDAVVAEGGFDDGQNDRRIAGVERDLIKIGHCVRSFMGRRLPKRIGQARE